MKITCIQMDMTLFHPEENYPHAAALVREAAAGGADVLVLPETWNTGFRPCRELPEHSDPDGARTKELMGSLAARFSVNIVAGSVSRLTDGKIYNTAYIFDRTGACIADYDKSHLFSPMGEGRYYAAGDRLCRFELDGTPCGLIICYDLRFPELTRALALSGAEVLFVVSQWPAARKAHLRALVMARAIENQMFVACCNSCGTAGEIVYGGGSAVLDPEGGVLAQAGAREELLTAELRLDTLAGIRSSIPVFHDRRPDIY